MLLRLSMAWNRTMSKNVSVFYYLSPTIIDVIDEAPFPSSSGLMCWLSYQIPTILPIVPEVCTPNGTAPPFFSFLPFLPFILFWLASWPIAIIFWPSAVMSKSFYSERQRDPEITALGQVNDFDQLCPFTHVFLYFIINSHHSKPITWTRVISSTTLL